MQLRQQKFYTVKNVYNYFKNNKTNILLFVHANDLNNIENILIRSYCKKNNIQILGVKLNIIKKITINKLFLQLNSGPTKIFSFLNFSSFLSFFNYVQVVKKFIPLSIYWINNFFSYIFFKNYLTYYTQKNMILNKNVEIITFSKKLMQNNIELLLHFNNNKLLYLLNIFILKKKC